MTDYREVIKSMVNSRLMDVKGALTMKQFKRYLLPLNLQHFSDTPPIDEPPVTEPTNPNEPPVDNKIPYDRFKKKVDEANELKRKLEELEKERDEAERKKLEEANEFKSLYEKTQAELEKIRSEAHVTRLDALKTELLVGAGYAGEQLDRVKKYVTGNDEETLKASLEQVKADIPPTTQGADPSPGNPPRHTPPPKDVKDEAKSFYEKLKASGRLRK